VPILRDLPGEVDMGERRQTNRQKSFLRGCIYFNKRRSVLDCLVRDISATGARLIMSEAVTVPDVVELHIPQKEETLRAHVQWRTSGEVGVAFGAQTVGKPVDDLATRVERLEAELVALKKLVKRLKAEIAGDTEEAA
jgi:PilZ domain